MKQKGINRVVVGVWDFDRGKQYFEKLLGAEFAPENEDGEAAAFGVRVAMAWESGIELISPLPGVQSPVRDEMSAAIASPKCADSQWRQHACASSRRHLFQTPEFPFGRDRKTP